MAYVTPQSPKSDQHQFSPNNFNTSSRGKVRRIDHKMIIKLSIGVWGTIAEIPYWGHATTLFRVALLIGWKFASSKQQLYPDLGGDASQYGISASVPETSLREETSEGVAKCRLFSQANLSQNWLYFYKFCTYSRENLSYLQTKMCYYRESA